MRRSGRYARIAIVGAATLAIAALGTATALALWSSNGSAVAPSRAGSVPKPPMPQVSAANDVVAVTLPAFPSGSAMTLRAYQVVRYEVNGNGTVKGDAVDADGTCKAPLAGMTTCMETIPGPGASKWRYAVRFLVGASWASAESNRSAPVSITGKEKQAPAGVAAVVEPTPTGKSAAPVLESTPSPAPKATRSSNAPATTSPSAKESSPSSVKTDGPQG